jgi:Na+-transporting methylmalonyl-CoA/oxaloacetate decarboxylase gamma subunit
MICLCILVLVVCIMGSLEQQPTMAPPDVDMSGVREMTPAEFERLHPAKPKEPAPRRFNV